MRYDLPSDEPNILKTLAWVVPMLMCVLCSPTPVVMMMFVGFNATGLILGILAALVVGALAILTQLVLLHLEKRLYWDPARRRRWPNCAPSDMGFWPWQW